MENKKANTNNLDPLKKKLDDPQHSRTGRDFKSAQWKNQPKTKGLKRSKERQPVLSIRSFQQVFEAIDMGRTESGELKNEWIIRAIVDRLQADHPEAYQWLQEQQDKFVEVRSDARTGIDFILDKN